MAPSQYVYSPLSLHDALPIYGSLAATIRENSCYEPACLITEWSPRCISPLAPSTSADLPIVEFSSVLLVMDVSSRMIEFLIWLLVVTAPFSMLTLGPISSSLRLTT